MAEHLLRTKEVRARFRSNHVTTRERINLDALFQDLRFGARQLLRSPGTSVISIATLAVGIGLNTAMYSVAHGLLKPLPVVEPEKVAVILGESKDVGFRNLSYVDYRDFEKGVPAFERLGAAQAVSMMLRGKSEDSILWGEIVSPNYFDVLRVSPVLGQAFEATQVVGEANALVLAYSTWQRRFGGEPSVVGRSLDLNGHAFTITGVAPKGFRGSVSVWLAPEYWITAAAHDWAYPSSRGDLERRGATTFRIVGRLRAEATLAMAQAQASAVAENLATQYPETNRDLRAVAMIETDTHPEPGLATGFRLARTVFLSLVLLVLFAACGNVATLLLTRAAARRKELAVRSALGGTMTRVIRQLLTEGILLAMLSGIAGIFLAATGVAALQRVSIPTSLPVVVDVGLDASVVLYAFSLCLVATLGFGLIPAVTASRTDLAGVLKGARSISPSRGITARNALVVAQVAVSLVLTVVAAVFTRSSLLAARVDWGLDPRGVALGTIDLASLGYDEPAAQLFYERVMENLQRAPGVESVALSAPVPLEFSVDGGSIFVDGSEQRGGAPSASMWSVVSPDYFKTVRTPIVSGRPIAKEDGRDATAVAVVNETFAQTHWPGTSALGRTFALGTESGRRVTVVGVAKDGVYRLPGEAPTPYVYLPLAQNYRGQVTIVVRAAQGLGTAATVATTRTALRAIDPRVPLFDTKSMDTLISGRALVASRLGSQFSGLFGLLALFLAGVGLFGALAQSVAARTREIGVRMAVGATATDVRRAVVVDGLRIALLGGALGITVALLVLPVLRSLLIGVTPFDPVSIAASSFVLLGIAVIACIAPAHRATKVDPILALRAE